MNTIDAARAAGIPWVLVAMHKVCLTAGGKTCDVGQDLLDLLLAKRVDLVLSGHDESYQRSKQLECGIRNLYVPGCVTNDGSSGVYRKGEGTVFLIVGVGGDDIDPINVGDAEYPYFAATMGDTTPGAGKGFLEYTVHPDRIEAARELLASIARALGTDL